MKGWGEERGGSVWTWAMTPVTKEPPAVFSTSSRLQGHHSQRSGCQSSVQTAAPGTQSLLWAGRKRG